LCHTYVFKIVVIFKFHLETYSAFFVVQKALKEKEEHIEQLIRERELERTEVFKTSIQKEEVS